MKINIEIDLTPQELRQAMGLPDVGGFQEEMMNQFVDGLKNSAERREQFLRMLVAGSMEPWQSFARMAGMPGSDRN